jgi:DnaK suppressor protein
MAPSEEDALWAERRAAQARLADLEAELAEIVTVAEASPPDDEHDVEGASVGYERARVIALLEQARRRIDDLDRADGDRARGSYGRCESCGQPVGAERLAALPTTRRCVDCAGDGTRPGLGGRRGAL